MTLKKYNSALGTGRSESSSTPWHSALGTEHFSNEYLITLARYLSEVGAYASTVISEESLDYAEECEDTLSEVLKELKSRGAIETEDDIYEIEDTDLSGITLSDMTVSQLELFYRQTMRDFRRSIALGDIQTSLQNPKDPQNPRAKHHALNTPVGTGHSDEPQSSPWHLALGTGYLESIISELLSRQNSLPSATGSAAFPQNAMHNAQCTMHLTPPSALDELKIAYCLDTYRNELEYLSSYNGTDFS